MLLFLRVTILNQKERRKKRKVREKNEGRIHGMIFNIWRSGSGERKMRYANGKHYVDERG